jgi:lipopolysaccharide export system ATP-binding protein
VVNRIALEINPGEVVGLLGPNGAGKTTTFYMIVGLIKPDGGTISLDGEDVSQCPMYIRARKGLNYLPQEPSIFRKLTVRQNIMAILETLPITAEERQERMRVLLAELDLSR